MISVVTQTDTEGSHPVVLRHASVEDSATFMENIYNDIKDAHKYEAITLEQIETLTDLLVELANRIKESNGES